MAAMNAIGRSCRHRLGLCSPLAAQTPPAPNPTLTADRAQMVECLRQSGGGADILHRARRRRLRRHDRRRSARGRARLRPARGGGLARAAERRSLQLTGGRSMPDSAAGWPRCIWPGRAMSRRNAPSTARPSPRPCSRAGRPAANCARSPTRAHRACSARCHGPRRVGPQARRGSSARAALSAVSGPVSFRGAKPAGLSGGRRHVLHPVQDSSGSWCRRSIW